MKQEFKIIADLIEKNTRVLGCGMWRWYINGISEKQ